MKVKKAVTSNLISQPIIVSGNGLFYGNLVKQQIVCTVFAPYFNCE